MVKKTDEFIENQQQDSYIEDSHKLEKSQEKIINQTQQNNEGGEDEDRIAKVFAGKKLFITGGTGFLGKVLIEKLIRCCTDLEKIYLLIRPKKGKEPKERIKDMFSNVLFDMVKEKLGEDVLMSKVDYISGDCSLSDLGLSQKDRKFINDEINMIYHCAATIRFDETLRKAVLLNTRGTKLMLELAKGCKKLEYFAHISTSYCHLHVKRLEEKVYDPPADPHKVIKTCEWLDDEAIESITKHILGDIPNTYAYTKSLSEALVAETFDELPTVILRPSIVIPIWKEPVPGWTDNINGPTGLLIGAGKGVLRTMYCNSSGYGDYLPVDIAVNGILVSTWNTLTAPSADERIRVAHMTSSHEIKISWQDVIEIGRWVIENKIPLNGVVWYPGGSMKSNYYVHYMCMILFHWIPAIIIDCLLWCLGYPPVLCRVHRRISKGFEVFEYYANNQWDFVNTEALRMRKLLNNLERHKYVIEKLDVDYYEYFEACVLCARRYILKEKDEDIPSARRHMRIMWYVDKICKILFIGLFIYFLYKKLFARFF